LFPNGIRRFEPGPANQPLAPNLPAGTITDDTEQALILADQLIKFQKNHHNSFPNSYLKNRNSQKSPKNPEGKKKHQILTKNSYSLPSLSLNKTNPSSSTSAPLDPQNLPPVLDPESYAQALLVWHQQKLGSGSLDLLGPSTLLALERLQNGDPDPGHDGSTNGAAMRITPVAIAFPPGPALEEAVLQASQLTHNTTPALTAAAAISGVVSSLIDEPDFDQAINYLLQTTTNFKNLGNYHAGADVQCRIEWVLQNHFSPDQIYNLVGSSLNSNESIPAVFALLKPVIETPTPELALHQLFEAAALGGDTDTISAILGAILGAKFGLGLFPQTMIDQVLAVNNLNLYAQVDHLLQIRAQYIFPKQQPGNPTPDPVAASSFNSTIPSCCATEVPSKNKPLTPSPTPTSPPAPSSNSTNTLTTSAIAGPTSAPSSNSTTSDSSTDQYCTTPKARQKTAASTDPDQRTK
jgi:ADP-ribosylglycohydrolase